jgi:hypothetical protein
LCNFAFVPTDCPFLHLPPTHLSITFCPQVLKGFKNSTLGREQEVFACMVHNLFDEYRFFPKYPDRELHTTGKQQRSAVQCRGPCELHRQAGAQQEGAAAAAGMCFGAPAVCALPSLNP